MASSTVQIDPSNNLEKVVLHTDAGSTAEVYLHGAHITSFKPVNHEEVIFVSKQAVFKPPKAIRGGVPVCWPQFNDMGRCSSSHGFARNTSFTVAKSSKNQVTLQLSSEAVNDVAFAYKFLLLIHIEVEDGETPTLIQTVRCPNSIHADLFFHKALATFKHLGSERQEERLLVPWVEVQNLGDEDMPTTNALHTYFAVSDISSVTVTGLESCSYLDNLEDRAAKDATGSSITIDQEVDRIYRDTGDTICIEDKGLKRRISLQKKNFSDAVVWNPWIAKAQSLGDFGDEEYKSMLCIEPANAAHYVKGETQSVAGKSTWIGRQRISVTAL